MAPASPPPPLPRDNRLVRVRQLRPDDVAKVQEIFAHGMHSLSPGVIRAGLLGRQSWRVYAISLVVGVLAAAWTARYGGGSSAALLALARSALVASLSFLAFYACYLSTIMDAYVKESLQQDMRDPLAFYCGGASGWANGGGAAIGGGDGKGRSSSSNGNGNQQQQQADNHSCFWVAELIEAPSTTTPGRRQQQQQQQQQQQREGEQSSGPAGRPTLRQRLLAATPHGENKGLAPPPSSSSPSPSSSIVGCVALQHRPGEAAAELRRMSVAECARGRGVAAALGEALERHARARGLQSVFCTTSSLQEPARALYGRRLGWTEVAPPPGKAHATAEANGITFHRYEKTLAA